MNRHSFAAIGAPLGHVVCVVVQMPPPPLAGAYQCECGCLFRDRAQLAAHHDLERALLVNDGHGARRT